MASEHTYKEYDNELESVRAKVLEMGGIVEEQLINAIEALVKSDPQMAQGVMDSDQRVNELEIEVDEDCSRIIARRQPAAGDLRMIMMILKTITDLERIGDLAKSVAKKIKPLPRDLPEELIASLKRLGELVQRQLKDVLDAYLNQSKEAAVKIWKSDERVDDLTHIAMNEVANFLSKDKKNLDLATHLLFVTKNIERAGDHITNIAEALFYLIEGEHIEGARPKGKDFDPN